MKVAQASIAATLGMMLLVTSAFGEERSLGNGDYGVGNRDWNGLSELIRMAQTDGYEMDVVSKLDFNTLTSADRLILLYPLESLPTAELSSFVIDGGKVLLADDFGSTDGFLERLGIVRSEAVSVSHEAFYLGRPGLPVFRPGGKHPLLRGVREVVANHPTALTTSGGAILPFEDESYGLVYDMRLAKGKVVVVGDASLFINHMLSVKDNKRFVHNALRYLCKGLEECRPRLLVGGMTFEGSYSSENGAKEETRDWLDEALENFNTSLESLEAYVPPSDGVYYASMLLMGGVVLFLLSIFHMRRPKEVVPETGPPEGVRPLSEFEWNLERFDRHGKRANHVLPVAILKSEFEPMFYGAVMPKEDYKERRTGTEAQMWMRRAAKRYVNRIGEESESAGERVKTYKEVLGLLTTLADIPARERLFLDSESSFSERDLLRLYRRCREILSSLELGEEYERRVRRGPESKG